MASGQIRLGRHNRQMLAPRPFTRGATTLDHWNTWWVLPIFATGLPPDYHAHRLYTGMHQNPTDFYAYPIVHSSTLKCPHTVDACVYSIRPLLYALLAAIDPYVHCARSHYQQFRSGGRRWRDNSVEQVALSRKHHPREIANASLGSTVKYYRGYPFHSTPQAHLRPNTRGNKNQRKPMLRSPENNRNPSLHLFHFCGDQVISDEAGFMRDVSISHEVVSARNCGGCHAFQFHQLRSQQIMWIMVADL
ncbi:hypothetical protein B0H13DRAFT_1894976 [Mycena leptocephala]|nr:hypothetical protein B0H13DRAFT_1894976 [Mycena leptocephala]